MSDNHAVENESKLFESSTAAMVAQVSGGEIISWTEDKKKGFVGTFKDRVSVARFILERTAWDIAETALNKKFIGQQHLNKLHNGNPYFDAQRFIHDLTDEQRRCFGYDSNVKIGGRDIRDLGTLAKERAEEVLKSLPPIQEALKVIDPETAKMLDRIDELKEQGNKLKEKLDVASEIIHMADLDQSMTIGDFRKKVKAQDLYRRWLIAKMGELGKEGSELERVTNKKLYRGLPGLAEAVMEVVQQHMDRSTALDQMSRRVEEQVMFGDSAAALDLLRHFEADETTITSSVKASFDAALEKLKLSVRRGKKSNKAITA